MVRVYALEQLGTSMHPWGHPGVRHLVRLLSARIHAIRGLSREWGICEDLQVLWC